MLKEIKLKNFKLHRDTKLEFGKITLFIGPNNSGKSSAIHAMQLLKKQLVKEEKRGQDAGSMFIDSGEGSYADNFARRGEKSFEIEISGTVPLKNILTPSEIEVAKSFISGDEIKVFSKYIPQYNLILPECRIEFLTYGFKISENNKIEVYTKDYYNHYPDLKVKNKKFGKTKLIIEKGNSVYILDKDGKPQTGYGLLEENFKGLSSNSSLGGGNLNEVLKNILLSPGKLIESLHFVYPIRGLEWQAYDVEKSKESSGLNLDNISIDKRAKSIANKFIYDRLLEDEIYEKMRGVVDVKFFAELSTGDKVKLLSKLSKKENIPFLFEGLGSHQMLFMLLPIALAKSNETIFIEEPETHLHPKAQYALSKLFTEISEKQGKQLVMTTHSEHIVFGFLNQVAKKQLKKDELKIYYFENKDGEAIVKELKVNEIGQVDDGLPGFFEAEVESLLEFLSAPDEEEK